MHLNIIKFRNYIILCVPTFNVLENHTNNELRFVLFQYIKVKINGGKY